jgi:hypothetical protein
MTYTLWHAGIMIGESAFDHPNPLGNPGQRAGTFHPTAYGRALFPRLSGIMTASADMADYLAARGLDPDTMDVDALDTAFEDSEAGRKIVDIGRALSEVEIRDEHSHPLPFKQIAFIDLRELRTLSRRLYDNGLDDVPADTDALIVSATLADGVSWRGPAPMAAGV